MLHSKSLRLLVAAAAAAAMAVDATTVTVTNLCGEKINFYDNSAVVPMNPGASLTRYLAPGFHGMFRNGVNPQATRTSHAALCVCVWLEERHQCWRL